MLRVQDSYEQYLRTNNCVGSIFALKNMGWRDQPEIAGNTYNTQYNIMVGSDAGKQLLDNVLKGQNTAIKQLPQGKDTETVDQDGKSVSK